MNKNYWERRQVEDAYQYFEEAENVADQISKVYLKASRYLSLAADEVFEKYQTKHGLREAEALRLINTLQDKASLDELLQQLKNSDSDKSKKDLLAKLEAPAYQARLERFRQIQNQLNIIMQDVYQQEKIINDNFYVDLARESYYKSIFRVQQKVNAAFGFDTVSAKVIDSVVHSRWSGKNYSERIWGNTQALAQDLKEELLINLITGRSNREAAEIIANKFAQGSSVARRLVRTESNYVCTEMNFKAYQACGIQRYRYLATLDLKTCTECCRYLDGKIFEIRDRKIGVNCPPMHPWCRCTIISVIDEEYIKHMQRIARDPVTGKNMKVPATMTYEEWYKKYVQGKPEAQLEEKKLKNKRRDQKQYDEYKKMIGKQAGKALDDFQNMKYNELEKWKFMKLDYQRRNELLQHPELKLPNAENAILPESKFTKYLFDETSVKGYPKGKAFTERLGYDADNWKKLRNELKQGIEKYPAQYVDNNGYGDRYVQKMVLYGKKGTPANVIVAWLGKADGTINLTSTYIKEAK